MLIRIYLIFNINNNNEHMHIKNNIYIIKGRIIINKYENVLLK